MLCRDLNLRERERQLEEMNNMIIYKERDLHLR